MHGFLYVRRVEELLPPVQQDGFEEPDCTLSRMPEFSMAALDHLQVRVWWAPVNMSLAERSSKNAGLQHGRTRSLAGKGLLGTS